MKKPIFALIPLIAAAAACDPLAGPGYPGEPLFTVSGTVESTLTAPPSTSVAIVWASGDPEVDDVPLPVAETVAVTGDFPAAFELNVYLPPADDARVDIDEPAGLDVAMGFIVALPAGVEPGSDVDLATILGVTNDMVVIYLGNEASVEYARTSISGGELQVGYNLLRLPLDEEYEEPSAYASCREEAFAEADTCRAGCESDPECDYACDDAIELGHCTALLDWFVPASTPLELVLDPDAVQTSVVWQVFGLATGTGVEASGDGTTPPGE